MADVKDITLKKLKAKEKAYTYNVGQGLSLLVKPTGSKLWEFRYTSPTLSKRRKTSLGNYPATTLAIAKKKRDEYHSLLAKELDPIDFFKEQERTHKLKTQGVFESVVNEWFDQQKKELAPATYKRKKNQFINDVNPAFINRTIASIKHPEIVKIIEIKNKKAPESASRLLSYLNNLWQYATTKGYCDFNIITNIHKKSILTPRKKKHYAKITVEQSLKILIDKIYSYKGSYSTKNALKFVLHIPLRANNLVNLKWQYIDLEKRLLTIPRDEMKVKDINIPDYVMPLTDEVVNILEEQKLFSKGTFVFNANGYSDEPICTETPNRALERMGFNDETAGMKIRLHGFRGTFRSLADTHQLSHNVSYEAKERVLDHLPKNLVDRAYTHKADYIKELEVLMRWWSDYINGLMK